MTNGSLRISSGDPSAIFSPKFSTVILSATAMTSRITCSTRIIVMFCLRARSTRSASRAAISRLRRPAAGSSSSRSSALPQERARGQASFDVQNRAARPAHPEAASPVCSSSTSASARRLFDAAAFSAWPKGKIRWRPRRHADETFSKTVRLRQSSISERAGNAASRDIVRWNPQQRTAVEDNVTVGGAVKTRDAIKDRGLASAIRPDERVNGAAGNLHRESD